MSHTSQLMRDLGIDLDPQLCELAFTHRSYAYENGGLPNNERLEFLGDAVLGVVVTEYLFRRFPDHPEGQLAKLRAAVVNSRALAEVARSLDMGADLRLGKGELATGGQDKASILADATEALIGAVMLSAGRDAATRLIHHIFIPLIEEAATLGAGLDWKTSLQELCASLELSTPQYHIEEAGPDHDKRFTAAVVVDGTTFPPGAGTSKKQAEQGAAKAAFHELSARPSPPVDA